jgi:hypothetical protein
MDQADTANKYLVGARGDALVMLRPPLVGEPISKVDALMLAAWLVALADPIGGGFDRALDAVLST